jgi:hypothetical protein
VKEKVDIHVECIPIGELEYNPLDIPIENKKSKVTLMSYFKMTWYFTGRDGIYPVECIPMEKKERYTVVYTTYNSIKIIRRSIWGKYV